MHSSRSNVPCDLDPGTIAPQTGFEFKKRRAFPVITGIVVAVENEQAVLEVCVFLLSATAHIV